VFISYSREDLAFADQLVVTLELAGFAPTIDLVGIHGAEKWEEKLGTLIGEADTVVFVLSPASARSKVCAWEVEQAAALGKRIIPVLCQPLGGVAPPPALAALNYIFFYAEPSKPGSSWGDGMRELGKTLRTDLAWLREHTRLLQRALEWEHGGKLASRLLSGEDILDAKNWMARQPRGAPVPTVLHLEFIRASEAREVDEASERQRQLAERERLVREAEAAQAARESAQREALAHAERARRQAELTARRTFVGLLVASVLAVAAIGAGWWARVKQQEAEDQSRAAREAVKVVGILFEQTTNEAKANWPREQREKEIFVRLSAESATGNRTAARSVGVLHLYGQGAPLDYDKARSSWERAAAAGDAGAMTYLGGLFHSGKGVAQDYAKAREWYEKSVAAGDAGAMTYLGGLFHSGKGVAQDYAKAREWYEKAVAAGDANGMTNLGVLYANGQGVTRDPTKAREWYEKAATAGNSVAMRNLGVLYATGQGVAQDYPKAREWYENAAGPYQSAGVV